MTLEKLLLTNCQTHLFLKKIESVQCNVALAITEAFKSFSCDKLYQELRLEYLHQRRWMRKVCLLYKFPSTEQPSHCSTNSLQLSKHLIFIFTSSAIEKFAETLQHFHRIFLNTSKILFFSYVMNEINLIQTFVALLVIRYFAMHC